MDARTKTFANDLDFTGFACDENGDNYRLKQLPCGCCDTIHRESPWTVERRKGGEDAWVAADRSETRVHAILAAVEVYVQERYVSPQDSFHRWLAGCGVAVDITQRVFWVEAHKCGWTSQAGKIGSGHADLFGLHSTREAAISACVEQAEFKG
jgi:hypothetical protein